MIDQFRNLIISTNPSDRTMFLWNAIGSGTYSFASLILTYLTIRIVGAEAGGGFAIALTLAQMFVYIAYFEIRNYRVTDTENKYVFADYHAVKIVLCILMILITSIYSLFKGYTTHKISIVILLSIYRMLDGYADLFEAEFHKNNRLDLAGKSLAFRTLLSVSIYFVLLKITYNLILSLIFAIVSGIIGIIIFDVWVYTAAINLKITWNYTVFKEIIKECFPLFAGMFLWTYILSASRIAVDNVLPDQYQAIYQILFMPVSVINLFMVFWINPNILRLTTYYSEQKIKSFWNTILKMVLALAGFTLICILAAFWIGIPILSFFVKMDLQLYKNLFIFLIFSGGINALAFLLYYILTIFRNRMKIILGYGIAAFSSLFISTPMVKRWNLWGAAISYAVSMGILLVIFVICIVIETKKKGGDFSNA